MKKLLVLATVGFTCACAQKRIAVPLVTTSTPIITSQMTVSLEKTWSRRADLYECTQALPSATQGSYEAVWNQLRDKQSTYGQEECVTIAALASCRSGASWRGIRKYLAMNPGVTCQSLTE